MVSLPVTARWGYIYIYRCADGVAVGKEITRSVECSGAPGAVHFGPYSRERMDAAARTLNEPSTLAGKSRYYMTFVLRGISWVGGTGWI